MITGQVLRKERRDAEVTSTKVGELMGITRQSVYRIERGQIKLTPAHIKAYRRALEQAAESKG